MKQRWSELWPDPSQAFMCLVSSIPIPRISLQLTGMSVAATLQTGLLFTAAVIVSPVYSRYPEHRRIMQYCGMIVAGTGLLVSGFVTAPWQLIVSIDILHPLGASLVYCES